MPILVYHRPQHQQTLQNTDRKEPRIITFPILVPLSSNLPPLSPARCTKDLLLFGLLFPSILYLLQWVYLLEFGDEGWGNWIIPVRTKKNRGPDGGAGGSFHGNKIQFLKSEKSRIGMSSPKPALNIYLPNIAWIYGISMGWSLTLLSLFPFLLLIPTKTLLTPPSCSLGLGWGFGNRNGNKTGEGGGLVDEEKNRINKRCMLFRSRKIEGK